MKFAKKNLEMYEKDYRKIVQKMMRDPTYNIVKFGRDLAWVKGHLRGLNAKSKRLFEISNGVLAEVVEEVKEELDELARHVDNPEKIDPQEWTTLNARMSCLKNGLLYTEDIREINHHVWIGGWDGWDRFELN